MAAHMKTIRPLSRSQYDAKHYNGARVHLELGFTRIGEQEPYFHALAGVEYKLRNNRWEEQLGRFACCADHESLAKFYPEFAHLVRWHLASLNTGPMHYEANAVFWAELATGKRPLGAYDTAEKSLDNFKSTIAWGALEGDTGEPWALPLTVPREDTNALGASCVVQDKDAPGTLRVWLRERLPRLMVAFKRDIDAAFPGMWDAAATLPPGRF